MTVTDVLETPAMSSESVGAVARPAPVGVRRRERHGLRPVEAALLERYPSQLAGSVLEVGSRGDRLTWALDHRAFSLTDIGLSSSPDRVVALGDGQFDAVFAGRCALDRLTVEERCQVLRHISRLLTNRGVLIFSTHNLAHASVMATLLSRSERHSRRLSYCVSPQKQERQLASYGLETLECVDRTDGPIDTSAFVSHERELHFVAQRARG
jgi:hypothetical protein